MRRLLLALGVCLLAATAAHAAERDVRLEGSPGPLVGTIATPAKPDAAKPLPAVLLLAGSGPVNRDDSIPQANFLAGDLKLIAQDLAAAGFTSLRADKRCVADSQLACPGEAKVTIQTYADDAVAWARLLQTQPGVRCVVLLGHSEGALVAALAAAKVKTCGVISISGVGRPLDHLIIDQVKASGAGPVVLDKVSSILAELKAGHDVADVPPALQPLFRPSVQPFVRSELAVDPAVALGAVKAPVLILQGTTDLQVSVNDARALNLGRPGSQLVLLPGVNHVLKTAPAERQANFATYARADLPLAPSVMPPILAFLRNLPEPR